MKKIFPFFLYPWYFKLAGLIISIAGIILMLVLNPDYQMLSYFGLILVIFSKEKEDTELEAAIRSQAYKTIFGYFIAYLFVVLLMEIIYDNIAFPANPFFLLGIPLILYIVYFNLLLLINRGKNKDSRKKAVPGYIFWLGYTVVLAVLLIIAMS